ncbi:hypothetical protein ACFQ5F_12725 [Kroppenstedtia eburnea]|uniref:hypothetical protein n=1 Tax=Kroppenstedtia eburnea TaxID=714067 RepID=UPI00020C8024|nr:sulfate ABC superfamily ATP binding cassette transporter, membrane protein [Desmospora sp. 8437]
MKSKFSTFLITWGLFLSFFVGNLIWEGILEDPFTLGTAIALTFAAAFYSGIVLLLFGIPVSILSD